MHNRGHKMCNLIQPPSRRSRDQGLVGRLLDTICAADILAVCWNLSAHSSASAPLVHKSPENRNVNKTELNTCIEFGSGCLRQWSYRDTEMARRTRELEDHAKRKHNERMMLRSFFYALVTLTLIAPIFIHRRS
jgi:hypothetical protein